MTHWLDEKALDMRNRIVGALTERAGELRELHHMHIVLDANAKGKIADIVVDALLSDEDCGCFHLPRHNPDCPFAAPVK